MTTFTWDIEATGLLDETAIDYEASPYVLRDDFAIHCIVVEMHETGELIAFYDGEKYELDGDPYGEEGELGYTYFLEEYEAIEYTHKQLKEFPEFVKNNKGAKVVAHNMINYDLLVSKLVFGMDFRVGVDEESDTWAGQGVEFEDTLVISKTLNPDRFGGHSLDNLGKYVKLEKIQFRKDIPQHLRFKEFAADMLYYCIRDVKVNTAVYKYLEWEKDDWKWQPAIQLEKKVAEIITYQEHRGFKFNKELAEKNIAELDTLMEERRQRVEPMLPPRPATKKFMSDHTPPASQLLVTEITPPKVQFKKNREPSAALEKFLAKWDGELLSNKQARIGNTVYDLPIPEDVVVHTEYRVAAHMVNFVNKHEGKVHDCNTKVTLFGKEYDLPIPVEPLKTEMVATIDDTTHIKNWLVGLGWLPAEYKEKDITVKSGPAKQKRTPEELEIAIDKYIEETLTSNFKDDRLAHIECNPRNIKRKMMKQCLKRSMKVLTNPSFTVGQDKEMCRDLERIAEQFPYAKDVVEYLTYKHRRNSILGGGVDWDDWEEDAEKGYLANVRKDGRIPTPADTCGAATSRFKHRVVVNIPRVSSLYGKQMREMFEVEDTHFQLGYDFSALEARIEGHYCYKYDQKDKAYCNSLIQEKPNDVHSLTATKISDIIGKPFERTPAKSVKYCVSYGGQPAKVAKTIGADLKTGELVFNAFWEAATPLKKLKAALEQYWETVAGKKFVLGIDGRKVPTRAKHALINSLFQSGGVISAKWTMVYHDQLMRDAGILVDFFTEDWKNNNFAQQLISMHDESQLEVSKGMFKFKVFETKEEAQEFKKTSDLFWSEPFSGKDNRTVLAYCEAGGLIKEAVELTNKKLNLKVPLAADYLVGRNWGDCH